MKMKLPAACGMSMKMNRSKTGGRLIGAHIKVLGSSGGKDSHYRVLDTRFLQSHGPYRSPCSLSPDSAQKEKPPSSWQGEPICGANILHILQNSKRHVVLLCYKLEQSYLIRKCWCVLQPLFSFVSVFFSSRLM